MGSRAWAGRPQVLSVDCYDVRAPTVHWQTCELKCFWLFCGNRYGTFSHGHQKWFHFCWTEAWRRSYLLPKDVDIRVGINKLQCAWKLNAQLEGTGPLRPAAVRWYQSSSKLITGIGFSPNGSERNQIVLKKSSGALLLHQMIRCYSALTLTISRLFPPFYYWHRPLICILESHSNARWAFKRRCSWICWAAYYQRSSR